MISRNIVFTEVNKAELIPEETRLPGDNEVLVKMVVSTISSGTERANLTGSDTLSWTAAPAAPVYPRRLGYSSAGIVEAVGNGVTDLKPGDRVAMFWTTHKEYITLSENNVVPIGDIPFEDAAMFHIATFPLAAVRKCRLEIGESAIVMGLGVLGLAGLKVLKAAGAVPVIAVDPDPEKREKALQCGADYALDPFAEDFAETAKRLTNGGAKVGIEVTGAGSALNGILDCMARMGRVALLGCTRNSDFSIDYYRKVHGPGITLVGAHTNARPKVDSYPGWWTQRGDLIALRDLTAHGRIQFRDMVDDTRSPEEAPEVYDRLAKGGSFPVTQFDWRRLS